MIIVFILWIQENARDESSTICVCSLLLLLLTSAVAGTATATAIADTLKSMLSQFFGNFAYVFSFSRFLCCLFGRLFPPSYFEILVSHSLCIASDIIYLFFHSFIQAFLYAYTHVMNVVIFFTAAAAAAIYLSLLVDLLLSELLFSFLCLSISLSSRIQHISEQSRS